MALKSPGREIKDNGNRVCLVLLGSFKEVFTKLQQQCGLTCSWCTKNKQFLAQSVIGSGNSRTWWKLDVLPTRHLHKCSQGQSYRIGALSELQFEPCLFIE